MESPGPIWAKFTKVSSLMYWWAWRELGARIGRVCPAETDPIFIVSPPRSGSTLFARLFGDHPNLVRWKERGRLWAREYNNPDVPSELRGEDLTDSMRQRIVNALSFFQWFHTSTVLIKQVEASLKLDAMVDLFPDLRLIVLFRDGRASVESLLRTVMTDPKRRRHPFGRFGCPTDFMNWEKADWLEKMCHLWLVYVQSIKEGMGQVPRHNRIQVRYEEFCQDPRSELQRIDEHLGLNPLKRNWARVPSKLPNQNWKFLENLSPKQRAAIEERIQDVLGELGYSAEAVP